MFSEKSSIKEIKTELSFLMGFLKLRENNRRKIHFLERECVFCCSCVSLFYFFLFSDNLLCCFSI